MLPPFLPAIAGRSANLFCDSNTNAEGDLKLNRSVVKHPSSRMQCAKDHLEYVHGSL